VGTVLLVWLGPYPVSMVGLDNATLQQLVPDARVTLGFLGLLQGGLLLALEPVHSSGGCSRPKPWRFTILVNARIMTLYLWHLTAMVAVIGISLALKGFGLHSEPLSGAWWATTAGVVGGARGGDRWAASPSSGASRSPAKDERPAPPDVARRSWPVSRCALGLGGDGDVRDRRQRRGVNWWWPLGADRGPHPDRDDPLGSRTHGVVVVTWCRPSRVRIGRLSGAVSTRT
jgi:hypothetical protein